jgi:branched-chain amino acid transport system ATP-binding protein
MEKILQVKGATIKFGGLIAVDSVDLEQKRGEILSLIGPNGAGKTTFFNLLTGVYQPTEGTVMFQGKNITNMKAYDRNRFGIARTFQNIRLIKSMTVLENILIAHPECKTENFVEALFFPNKTNKKRRQVIAQCQSLLNVVGLEDMQDEMAMNLPYGKQRLLEIARGLATNPKLLLLDEPGAGMNSFEKEELTNVIHHITGDMKIDVLIIEHDMKFIMGISDRIIVLDHGQKIAEGIPSEIQNNEKVIQAYLGSGEFKDEEDQELPDSENKAV